MLSILIRVRSLPGTGWQSGAGRERVRPRARRNLTLRLRRARGAALAVARLAPPVALTVRAVVLAHHAREAWLAHAPRRLRGRGANHAPAPDADHLRPGVAPPCLHVTRV